MAATRPRIKLFTGPTISRWGAKSIGRRRRRRRGVGTNLAIFSYKLIARISNLFTNTLKSVRPIMMMQMMTLIVHKMRRGPCGTGKMWGELCESMDLLTKHPARNAALIERYSDAILNDRGLPRESSMSTVIDAMRQMLVEGKGPVVQMRRWFTIFDAAIRQGSTHVIKCI